MNTSVLVATLAALLCVCACDRHRAAADTQRAEGTSGVATTLPVVATDDGFEAPDHVASGLRHIVYRNAGSQIHEAMFVKLAPGMSAEDYVDAVRGGALFPEGARDYSGAGLTSPGGEAELWLTLDPGEYIIICWYRNHAETIPVHRLSVDLPRRDDPAPPPADVVVRLIDFRFELEGSFSAGEQVMRVETVGPHMHEMDIYRLDDGKTFADFEAWHKNDMPDPAPGRAGTGVLDNHDITRVTWVRRRFEPGRYVLWCEMPMTADPGAPVTDLTHADVGMHDEFTISE